MKILVFRERLKDLAEKMSPKRIPNKLPISKTNRYRAGYTVYMGTIL